MLPSAARTRLCYSPRTPDCRVALAKWRSSTKWCSRRAQRARAGRRSGRVSFGSADVEWLPIRHLITSALPYINGVKHLGNLVGSMLPADVYARFQRARGNEVLFICATDEHGTPAELAAHEAGLPIDEYCARMHAVQKVLGDR